jgi:hypothetical protein
MIHGASIEFVPLCSNAAALSEKRRSQAKGYRKKLRMKNARFAGRSARRRMK